MKTLIIVIVHSMKGGHPQIRFLRSDKDEMRLHGVRMSDVPFANPLYSEMSKRFYRDGRPGEKLCVVREDLEWDRGQLSEQWDQIVYCYINDWRDV